MHTYHPHSTHYPWYSLNPKSIHAKSIILPILILVLALCFSEKHLWRWDWNYGLHALCNLHPVVDAHGKQVDAWRWVDGQEIRIYVPANLSSRWANDTLRGVQSLVSELHLAVRVQALPEDERIQQAIRQSTTLVAGAPSINFDRLCRVLVATRQGKYAEMVIAPGTIDQSDDTLGMANFTYGTAILNEQCTNRALARHETGHLLGYYMHDDWPFAVFGYKNPQLAKLVHAGKGEEVSLMMPILNNGPLSERSRDAITNFWCCLERHTGRSLFTK
jgi:hypothetical protein